MKYLHSYDFPYLVEAGSPAELSSPSGPPTPEALASPTATITPLARALPKDSHQNGFLRPACKELLIHLITIQSVANQTHGCLVLDLRECVYITPEGLVSESDRPPLLERELPFPVPEGLAPCDRCGYQRGECLFQGRMVQVACPCQAQICGKCHTPVNKFRIGTCVWDPRDGQLWNVPLCSAWGHRCRTDAK